MPATAVFPPADPVIGDPPAFVDSIPPVIIPPVIIPPGVTPPVGEDDEDDEDEDDEDDPEIPPIDAPEPALIILLLTAIFIFWRFGVKRA
ncbi:MAG: hypothetical protein AAGD92_15590 [Pseudomonadota bacterium]